MLHTLFGSVNVEEEVAEVFFLLFLVYIDIQIFVIQPAECFECRITLFIGLVHKAIQHFFPIRLFNFGLFID